MVKDGDLLECAKRFFTRPIFLYQTQNGKDARMPDDVRIMQELIAMLRGHRSLIESAHAVLVERDPAGATIVREDAGFTCWPFDPGQARSSPDRQGARHGRRNQNRKSWRFRTMGD